MNIKKTLALLIPITLMVTFAGCGKKNDDKKFVPTENVKVSDAENIQPIPDNAEKEIIFLGEYDLNPTEGSPEKSTELQLFESKGGKIGFRATSNDERFNDLASAIMANKDVPDIFKYEWLAFPSQVIKQMYQPIDDIVDFSDPLWKDSKDTADQFVLNDKHYVAPLGYSASAMLCYDKSVIVAEGLADPYELYENDSWTWNAWKDIMSDYVGAAGGDEVRYGVNGFFRTHIIQQTGKKFVEYDMKKNQFVSNMNDPDIENGQDFLYDLTKEGLVLDGWIGSARECFDQNCLFYAMGDWAYSGANSPSEKEHWGIVPIPQYDENQQKITTSDMTSYMWVRGSEKRDAVKCWLECCRASYTDPKYAETNKAKFMENNPYWTEEMYKVKTDAVSEDYLMLFDYAYGISSVLGNKNNFDGEQCLVDALYNQASTISKDGVQYTWAQVREMYSEIVDMELNDINEKITEINAPDDGDNE